MNIKFLSFLAPIFLMVCSPPDMEEELLIPEAANLVFPENNKECNTGVEVNETQSRVSFRWENAENTDAYEVFVVASVTGETVQIASTTNVVDIVINKATFYEWYVVSKSDLGDATTTSETYQFYNAGDAAVSHSPFAAEGSSPIFGTAIEGVTSINLEWMGHDIDDDIIAYEVFFGIENPPNNSLGTIADTSLMVDVASGNTYHWQIRTIDAIGNRSDSDVFWFRVD
ncbi:MAG: hypothetical protein AAF039_10710 [Bacteroidota bacterium]